MRYLLILSLILFTILLNAQSLEESLSKPVESPDCKSIAINAADSIVYLLKEKRYATAAEIVSFWEANCGGTEVVLRTSIMISMLRGFKTDSLIEIYFYNDFEYQILYRQYSYSKYDFRYTQLKKDPSDAWLPYGHKLDFLMEDLADSLLQSRTKMTTSEEIVCLLFSQRHAEYYALLNSNPADQNLDIGIHVHDRYYNMPSLFSVEWGYVTPLGNAAYHQAINLGFSLKYHSLNHWIHELSFRLRFHLDPKDYQFKIEDEIEEVNSAMGLELIYLAKYKVINKPKFKWAPSLGIGIESMNTGIRVAGGEADEYYYVESINFAAGFDVMTMVNDYNYMGVKLHFVHAPYNQKDLISNFAQNRLECAIYYNW